MAERKTKAIFSQKDQKKAYDAMLQGKISFDEYLGISMQSNDDWAEQAVRRIDAASDVVCSIIDMDTEKNIMRQDMIKKVKNVLNSMVRTKGNPKEVELGKKLLKLYNKILNGKYHQEEDSADTIAGKIFGPSEKEIEERRKLEAVLEYIIENINNISLEEEDTMGRLVKSDIYRLFEGTQTGAAKKLQKLMEEDEKKDKEKKTVLDKLSDFAKDPFGKKDDDKPVKSVFDKFFTDEDEEDKDDPLLDYDNGKLILFHLKKVYKDPDTSENDKKFIKVCLEFYQDYTKEDISSYKKKDAKKMVEILMDILEKVKKEEEKSKSKKVKIDLDFLNPKKEEEKPKKIKIDLDFLNPKDPKKKDKKKSILDFLEEDNEKPSNNHQDKKIDKKINLLEEGVKTLINTFAAFEKRFDEKERKQSQQSQNPSSNKKNLAFDWIKNFRYEDVGGNKNDFYKVLGRLNKLSEALIENAGRLPSQGSFHLVKKSYKSPENFCIASVDGKKIFWLFGKDNCNLYNESEFPRLKEDLKKYETTASNKKTTIEDIFEEKTPEQQQEPPSNS